MNSRAIIEKRNRPDAAAFDLKRVICAPDASAEAAGFDLFPAVLFRRPLLLTDC